MAYLSRRRWLEEGLALLEEAGAEALTIESLTSRLGVTNGSFYHHFANSQDFQQRLLESWEEEGTLRIIHWADQEDSPPDKLARVIRASFHPPRLDVALRAGPYKMNRCAFTSSASTSSGWRIWKRWSTPPGPRSSLCPADCQSPLQSLRGQPPHYPTY